MKKICFIIFMFCFTLLAVTTTTATANTLKSIGIIIISADEFKSEVYFNRSASIFNADKNSNIKVEVGESLQQKYSDYCKDKEISDNEPPRLENLLEFTVQNNFDYLLCLVIKEPEVSKYMKKVYGGQYIGEVNAEHFTVSMTINAYMCDKTKLLKTHSVTKNKIQDVRHSRNPQAKATRGAFTLCINDIKKSMNGLW